MGGDGEKKEGEEEKKEENGGNEAKEEDKVGESWFYFLPFFLPFERKFHFQIFLSTVQND